MINAKRVKSLRKTVKQYLGDLPQVVYRIFQTHSVAVPDFSRGLQADGTPHMKLVPGVSPLVLAKGCQRFAYKAAKKHITATR